MRTYTVPEPVRLTAPLRDLPPTSRYAFYLHAVKYPKTVRHALRAFQAVPARTALRIYAAIVRLADSYDNLPIHGMTHLTWTDVRDELEDYLVHCLRDWEVHPLEEPPRPSRRPKKG